jgi:hypothetical protein
MGKPMAKTKPVVVFTVTTTECYVIDGNEQHTAYNGSPPDVVERDWFGRKPMDQHGLHGSHASRDRHVVQGTRRVVKVERVVVTSRGGLKRALGFGGAHDRAWTKNG